MAWLKKISSLSSEQSEKTQATSWPFDQKSIEGVRILVLEPRFKIHALHARTSMRLASCGKPLLVIRRSSQLALRE